MLTFIKFINFFNVLLYNLFVLYLFISTMSILLFKIFLNPIFGNGIYYIIFYFAPADINNCIISVSISCILFAIVKGVSP